MQSVSISSSIAHPRPFLAFLYLSSVFLQFQAATLLFESRGGGGGTPKHYLYGYVPPNGVVILKLLIKNGVSISEAFSRTGYNIQYDGK